MSFSKLDQLFKFISQFKYEISENVPNNLKCGKCKNILINAYCVPCGCSYCCDCVNEMLNIGVENCPGQTEDCKEVLISNNHVDFRINKEISNVVMKCPEEMCLYECAIINMEEHVRVCEKKSVKCPLANVGCDGKKIAREMLNDHCQSANFNHFKILIEIIDNMRNEIDILKANDEKNQLKIENLEKNLNSKTELEKETVKQDLFDSFKSNLERKIEDKIDDKMKRENDARMKIEKDEHKREWNKINENFERDKQEIFGEIQKEKQDRIQSINDERKSINEIKIETNKKLEMMETRINKLNKIIELKYPLIEWKIDKLDEKRKQGGSVCSEYFIGMMKQYKLQLSFYANGYYFGGMKGKGCQMYLYISPGANDQLISWPFTADVTIKMMSKTNPNINKSIKKYCKIDKPTSYSRKWSESFDYFYCDLTNNAGMLDNCFIVECFIDFK